MRAVCLVLLLLLPGMTLAQSRVVAPGELELWVEVEETPNVPMVREQVLLTIRGIYRRHITREKVVQPSLEGFSWTQLGNDVWRDERLDGQKVKTFSRRMAVYPDRAGRLEIGAFAHELTLTDESDKWFVHHVKSAPLTIEVAPAPAGTEWWFPVRGIKVADQWSNPPDLLQPGEGVLRIIRIEALGVTPEMIPPMPELTSPSAMIFAHPEKRFVELTPYGPRTFAFWRWTIRPGNDVSAIVEPLRFSYFDTQAREPREVTISAQRVAYGTVTPEVPPAAMPVTGRAEHGAGRLPGWPMALLGLVVFVGLLSFLAPRGPLDARRIRQRVAWLDPLRRQVHRAARARRPADMRRAIAALMQRDGPVADRRAVLADLDAALFAPAAPQPDLRALAARATRNPPAV